MRRGEDRARVDAALRGRGYRLVQYGPTRLGLCAVYAWGPGWFDWEIRYAASYGQLLAALARLPLRDALGRRTTTIDERARAATGGGDGL